MGMLLQRNRKRRTQEIEEVVSDIQSKEVTTSKVEKTDEKPKRKPRARKE